MMRARQMRDQSHGGYSETTSEKEVMDYTTYVFEEILNSHLTLQPAIWSRASVEQQLIN